MFYQYAIILTLYCAFVKQKFLPKESRAHIENMVQSLASGRKEETKEWFIRLSKRLTPEGRGRCLEI
jgi:hypothetical protein